MMTVHSDCAMVPEFAWRAVTVTGDQFALQVDDETIIRMREEWRAQGRVTCRAQKHLMVVEGSHGGLRVTAELTGDVLAVLQKGRGNTIVRLTGDRWLRWITPNWRGFARGFVTHTTSAPRTDGHNVVLFARDGIAIVLGGHRVLLSSADGAPAFHEYDLLLTLGWFLILVDAPAVPVAI